MTDDWNLKDKKYTVQQNSMGEIHERTNPNTKEREYSSHDISYTEEDIETLRQKLIGDVINFCKEHYWEYDTSILALIKIINQRFGVKE